MATDEILHLHPFRSALPPSLSQAINLPTNDVMKAFPSLSSCMARWAGFSCTPIFTSYYVRLSRPSLSFQGSDRANKNRSIHCREDFFFVAGVCLWEIIDL